MSRGRIFTIRSRQGTVIHEERADSFRKFVEGLIRRRFRFENADLRGWHLKNLEMDGVVFSGADLTGADLTGSSVCGANFRNAVMKGIKADGLRARNACFEDADLSPAPADATAGSPVPPRTNSHLRGADLSGADLRHAVLDEADLSGATLVAANLSSARMARCTFSASNLRNAQFVLARISSSDFTGADLASDTGAPSRSQPDRTAHAEAVDNVYDQARLDEGVPAFKRDRRIGKGIKAFSWGASAAAIAGAATLATEGLDFGTLDPGLGQGLVLLACVKLVALLQDRIEDVLRDHLGSGIFRTLRAGKEYLARALRNGAEVGSLAAVVAKGPGFGLLRRALASSASEAQAKGAYGAVMDVLAGRAQVIFCDRRHLATALTRLHVERSRGLHLERDIVLVRWGEDHLREREEDRPAPLALRLMRDGSVGSVWRARGGLRSAVWDAEGALARADGFLGPVPTLASTKAAFEVALWQDHGLRRPYITNSHQVVAGRDGSIQVIHERSGSLNNPWGPAYIGLDDKPRHYRKGVEVPAPDDEAPRPGL